MEEKKNMPTRQQIYGNNRSFTTISKNELNDLYNKLQLKEKMIEKARKILLLGKSCSIIESLSKKQLQTCFSGLMYFIIQALAELEE